MVAPTVEHGTGRQVWFAPVATPASKTPFVIRDDAYSRRGVIHGQKLRLGDPVDSSLKSAFVQTTWQGGEGQDFVKDEEMYKKGSADTTQKLGKVKLQRGLEIVREDVRNVGSIFLGNGQDWYLGGNNLLIWEGDNLITVPNEETSWKGWDYDAGGLKATRSGPSPVVASSYIEQDLSTGGKAKYLIALKNGEMWRFQDATNLWAKEYTLALAASNHRALTGYNGAVYGGTKYRFYRRTWDTTAKTPTYVKVKDINWVQTLENFVVWNNRIWMTGRMKGYGALLLVSDGTTIQEAFKLEGSFRVTKMVVHYGSLYILGYRPKNRADNASVGEVWRYNGTSLQKIWTEPVGDPTVADDTPVWAGCSWNQYLVWGRTSGPTSNRLASLMFYDHELDAVVQGPTIPHEAGGACHITDVNVWQNTLAIAAIDNTDYSGVGGSEVNNCIYFLKGDQDFANDVGTVHGGHSFSVASTTRSEKVISSVFDGEVAYEAKTWLTAKVRCAIPQGTTIDVKAIFDESETETTLTTLGYSAPLGTGQTVREFPIQVSSDYVQSETIQYVFYLNNSDTSTYPAATPEVDSVVIEYMLSPESRKEWHIRVLANDNQLLLDDSANSLTTRNAIEAAAEALFDGATPVLFWDAQADNTTPTGDGAEVMVHDFNQQSYMLDTSTEEVVSEITLGLSEFG